MKVQVRGGEVWIGVKKKGRMRFAHPGLKDLFALRRFRGFDRAAVEVLVHIHEFLGEQAPGSLEEGVAVEDFLRMQRNVPVGERPVETLGVGTCRDQHLQRTPMYTKEMPTNQR